MVLYWHQNIMVNTQAARAATIWWMPDWLAKLTGPSDTGWPFSSHGVPVLVGHIVVKYPVVEEGNMHLVALVHPAKVNMPPSAEQVAVAEPE
mmetsp:Transcript_14063/g.33154  ORF Transcript_14063/g.33154 Transcript_14063/m.33154 type:complete len:92 (+) Transcript_14063:182-457(+)